MMPVAVLAQQPTECRLFWQLGIILIWQNETESWRSQANGQIGR